MARPAHFSIRPALLARLSLLTLLSALAACHGRQGGDDLLAEAQAYRQKGETRAAVIELKNALQKAPGNAQARLLLGEVYLDSGDPLSAEKELRKALTLGLGQGQGAERVWPTLGKAMLMLGQFDKILLELPPDPPQPALQILRANAYMGLGKTDTARAIFTKVLQQQPGLNPALLGMARIEASGGQPDRAIELVLQALAKDPADGDALRLHGDILRNLGKNDAALLAYQKILQLHPDNTTAHIDIANLHIQAGRYAEAKAQIGAARKTAPNSLGVVYAQALLDFREGRHKVALEGLQQILKAAPEHMPSLLLAGAVQLALGAPQQAEDHLRRFLEANPGNLYASKLLASIALARGQGDAALDMLAPLLKTNPDDVDLLSLAGEAHMRAGRYSQATSYFEQASVLAPRKAELHAALGVSRLGLGENARAVAELERATELGPAQSQAGVMLVMTLLRNHDNDKALATVNAMEKQMLEQAGAKKQAANPLVYNLKGGVQLALQDTAGARSSFEQALGADPLYMPALENLSQLDIAEKTPEQARLRLEAAWAKRPKDINLTLALAKLASLQGKPADTLRWLEQARKDQPQALQPAIMLSNFYLQHGDVQKALTLAQNMQSANPDNPETLALRAQVEYGAGNAPAALESYQKLAALQTDSAQVQMRIAGLQIGMSDSDAALQSVRKALVLNPQLLEAQVTEAALLTDKKRYGDALAVARRLQQQRPQLGAGFKLEGDVLMAQNQPLPALVLYDKAFAISNDGALQVLMHRALSAGGKTNEAERRIDAWLVAHPDDIGSRLYLAGERLGRKQYAGAIEQYEKIVTLDARHVIALNDLAWAYQQQQDSRALATAERALALAPGNPVVQDTLGWILLSNGDAKRALPMLRQAAAASPKAADVQYHLAVGLMKNGDKAAARKQLEQVLSATGKDGKDGTFTHRAEAQALLAQL